MERMARVRQSTSLLLRVHCKNIYLRRCFGIRNAYEIVSPTGIRVQLGLTDGYGWGMGRKLWCFYRYMSFYGSIYIFTVLYIQISIGLGPDAGVRG